MRIIYTQEIEKKGILIKMRENLQALIMDIDGVITDGKKYTDGISQEIKSIAYKDLDAIKAFQDNGILVGCISGEDTEFSRWLAESFDYSSLGKKNKKKVLEEFSIKNKINKAGICYIGDGKYDIEALEYAGLSVCPCDAIHEVKTVSDIILNTSGGQGCIAELYTIFYKENKEDKKCLDNEINILDIIKKRIDEHESIVNQISKNEKLLGTISDVCKEIIDSYKNKGQLFLCGNGGSAADAQHLAAELIGRFYLERRAYSAEALSTNTSVVTSLANDYDYSMIFARQVAAKGREGDILIGITTSGKSANILKAFKQAKDIGMLTVLLTGEANEYLPILEYTDYTICISSRNTPRIQEGHILIGHIMCEIIEAELAKGELKNE